MNALTGLLIVVMAIVSMQVVLVAIAAATFRGANIYKVLIGTVFLTAPLVFFGGEIITGQALSAEGRVFLVLLHLGLGGLFFHFMTLPDRSVTLRILVELHLAPNKALSIADLNRRYSVRDMIRSRLDQLAHGQFLAIAEDGRLTLRPRGERFGRFVVGGRRLFRIESAN